MMVKTRPEPVEFQRAPTLDDIHRLAQAAHDQLPQAFLRQLGPVQFVVQEFPDDALLDEMGCESPYDLLGLYEGVALTEKSVVDIAAHPDRIFLFRRPILDYWCEHDDDLADIVRHVLIHEIGHHFGFSDDDMDRLEQAD